MHIRFLVLCTWSAIAVMGCATQVRSPIPPPRHQGEAFIPGARYYVSARITRQSPDLTELAIKTRAVGCHPFRAPMRVTEKIEFRNPEGLVIRALDKNPDSLGDGRYEGNFIIELPNTIPFGRYGVTITLRIDDQICVRHQGFLNHYLGERQESI